MGLTKNKYIIFIVLAIIIVLLFIIIMINYNYIHLEKIFNFGQLKRDEIDEFSYFAYDNKNDQNILTLITVQSDSEIEYIETPEGLKIYGNGKQKISFDYAAKKNEEKYFKVKEGGKPEEQKRFIIDNAAITNSVSIEKIADYTGYKTIKISNNIILDGYKVFYQIGKNGTWQEGEGNIYVLDYDVRTNNLINDDETITISAKIQNTNGYTVTYSEDYQVDMTSTMSSFQADSLLDAMEEYDMGTGVYKVTVEDVTYSLHVYSFDQSMVLEANTTLGTEEDVANSSRYAQNMIVYKVNGDLTINEGITLTSYASKDGYGGPKGMMIYCTGTLTNNGTISMTARGAYAEGENVYLLKNIDGSYEYVPAEGASGGTATSSNGNKGNDGKNRQLGGGGAGGAGKNGSAATSYSGGTGGGGSYNGTGSAGGVNGGKGGSAGGTRHSPCTAGGGAGNPGGNSTHSSTRANGTGGLLIIYGNNVYNNNSIVSNGVKGASPASTNGNCEAGGGSSGGGSINIFYKEEYQSVGSIYTNGGSAAYGEDYGNKYGGAGGKGTITITQIVKTKNFKLANNSTPIDVGGTTAETLKEYYGQTVDNSFFSSNEGNDWTWQLFYDDLSYIFLVSSDYIPYDKLPNDLIRTGDYSARFSTSSSGGNGALPTESIYNNGAASTSITNNRLTEKYLKWVDKYPSGANSNIKAVAFMMDTNKWSAFAGDLFEGAEAIGGPTMELYAKSWNAVPAHSSKQLETYDTMQLNVNYNSSGYYIKTNINNTAIENTCWYINKDQKTRFWNFAAPSSDASHCLIGIWNGGNFNLQRNRRRHVWI